MRLTFVNFTFIMYHIIIMPQNRIRIVDVADTLGLSSMASKESNPSLTTIHQEANLRAKTAIKCLEAMRDGTEYKPQIVLPVDLRQYRIILSADTASEVRQLLSQKRR